MDADEVLKEWVKNTGLDENEIFQDTEEAEQTRLETLKELVEDVKEDYVYQNVMLRFGDSSNQVLNKMFSRITTYRPSLMNDGVDEGDGGTKQKRFRKNRSVRSSVFRKLPRKVVVEMAPEEEGSDILHTNCEKPLVPDDIYREGLRCSLINSSNPYSLWPSRTSYRSKLSSLSGVLQREGFQRRKLLSKDERSPAY
ncbi:uncharacterized protein LOC111088279 [Limulus polyphemus]|uniref:Uncharacterized protein LOC111088279 n=1 Tax=Limulus polyphemus TaxID=6850 RepID=A0ABM1TCN6_LIMPO|nr:uncharacterized protein LOC111088279 [Limulus polyphemus]